MKLVDQIAWQQLQLQLQLQLHYGDYKIICQFLLLTEIQKQNDHQPNSQVISNLFWPYKLQHELQYKNWKELQAKGFLNG